MLLLGGECTGKSALAESLTHAAGAIIVPEQLRGFVNSHGRTPEQDEQAEIAHAQQNQLDQVLADTTRSTLIVCDPAPIMTAIYSVQYFDDRTLLDAFLSPPASGAAARDTIWVWCQPDLPWIEDGLHRDGPDARARTHELIKDLVLPRLADDRLVIAHGSIDERVTSVLSGLAP